MTDVSEFQGYSNAGDAPSIHDALKSMRNRLIISNTKLEDIHIYHNIHSQLLAHKWHLRNYAQQD